MTENIENPKYLSVVERYFQEKFYKNEDKPGQDTCVLIHSNRICIVTLPEGHPIRSKGHKITKVAYQFANVNRLCNRVTGKGKKGAQNLHPNSGLCEVTCEDGSTYIIQCGLKCQLLEINDNLKTNPGMLTQKPQTDGFIAIVLPKLKEFDGQVKQLLTKDQYLETR